MKNNIMRKIDIEKVTLNCGTGIEKEKLEKSVKLLQIISGKKPIRIETTKRIPGFNVRPGLEIGCKVTIRNEGAKELLKRLLESIGNKLKKKQITPGTFAFGIKEYLQIPGIAYQRDIGMLGLEVCVTLTRAGYNVKDKKIKRGKLPQRQRITKEETIKFIEDNFKIEIQ